MNHAIPAPSAARCWRPVLLRAQLRQGASGRDGIGVVGAEDALADGEGALEGQVWREMLGSELGAALRTPATPVGVAQLGYDGQLVEIECTAAVPLA